MNDTKHCPPSCSTQFDFDGCEFFTEKDYIHPGVILCRHEMTEKYPVSFTLLYLFNGIDNSEKQSYKLLSAVMYHTVSIKEREVISGKKEFYSKIEVTPNSNSEINKIIEEKYKKIYNNIITNGTELCKLHFEPPKEIKDEAKKILKDCKDNYLPFSSHTLNNK